ncbi:MAG: hypothetical protein A2Z66_06330 [Chloroflexi bacterium RBG_13_66_10]|nr:MAG: hypothetical protein A2Z66_06330 [Chloroflexi bacterium RBG_13_66_10]
MVELARIARRLVLLFRPILGLFAIVAALALVIPIADSLWAQRLIGAGTVHTGSWTPEDHGCTYTQGYWRNHPEAWPQDQIEIGGVAYLDAEAIAILETAPGGDATYILAHQLIAATVNVLNGADPDAVQGTIQEANAWLEARPLGSAPANPERDRGIELSVALMDYNEGRIGPGQCEDEECTATATATVTDTAIPTATSTPTPTETATATPTPLPARIPGEISTETPTSTPSPTSSDTPAPPPTDTSTATPEPTANPTDTLQAAPTETPEPIPTETAEPPPSDTPVPDTPA